MLVDKCSSMAFGAIHGRRIYLFSALNGLHTCHSLLNTLSMKKFKTLTVLCKLFLDLVFSNKLWNYTENKWIYVFF